jgi:hypothetical protein
MVRAVGGAVFICHASEDAEQARDVVRILEDADVACWIAPRDIQAGEGYTEAILQALTAAPALVLLFSAAADRSPHVVRELETAVGSGTRIVPVRLEQVEPSHTMRYFIGTAQWLDVAGRTRADWGDELVAAVRRAVAAPGAVRPATGPAPPGKDLLDTGSGRRRVRGRIVPMAAAALVAIVVAAVALVAAMGDPDEEADGGGRTPQSESSGPSGSSESSESPESSESSEPSASATPAGSQDVVIVAEESFQRGPGSFGVGDLDVNTGVMTREVRNGAYRVGVRGIGPGWDSWNYVEIAPIEDLWSVTTAVSRADGFCGVMVGDGVTTYTAVVNGAGTEGEINRHVGGSTPEEKRFPVEPAGSGPVTLTRDGDTLVLSAGQTRVEVVDAVDLGPITEAGLDIVGDTATCEFDSFSASHLR